MLVEKYSDLGAQAARKQQQPETEYGGKQKYRFQRAAPAAADRWSRELASRHDRWSRRDEAVRGSLYVSKPILQ